MLCYALYQHTVIKLELMENIPVNRNLRCCKSVKLRTFLFLLSINEVL